MNTQNVITTTATATTNNDTPPVSLASAPAITPVTPQAKVKDPKWIEAGKKAWTTRLANRAAAQNGQPVQPKVKNPKRIEAGMKAWATRVANKAVAQTTPAPVLTTATAGGEPAVA